MADETGKNIVILADGTWNQSGRDRDTNVVNLYHLIERDTARQIAFYDEGIGADRSKLLGGAFGVGISKNICDSYRFLVEHYRSRDRVFLYGFSRGAYTVRSLTGFISRCGLLERKEIGRIKQAYDLYRRQEGPATVQTFKERYARPCRIRLIGVWDTVGALGIPISLLDRFNPFQHRFHDTRLSDIVEYGLHALAIDDDRLLFHPTLWDEANEERIKQVWFAGVHSDVGGWYPDRGLSDITLRWMIEESKRHGLRLTKDYREKLPINHKGRLHPAREGWGRLIYLRKSRHIPTGKQTHLHRSVLERLQRDDYRPANLKRHGNLADHYTIVDTPNEADYPPYELAIGQSRTVKIYAKKPWNDTRLLLAAGRTYRFEARGYWHNLSIKSTAAGYNSDSLTHRLFAPLRRAPQEKWFALIGSLEANECELFRLGESRTITLDKDRSGMLTCFANDPWPTYWNNTGFITLTVTRVEADDPAAEKMPLTPTPLCGLQRLFKLIYSSPTLGIIFDGLFLILLAVAIFQLLSQSIGAILRFLGIKGNHD